MLNDDEKTVLHTERMRERLERLATGERTEPRTRAIACRALSDPAGLSDREVELLVAALMGGGPARSDATS